ncbi:MAG: thioredoxin family protein [Candidatus Aenigmarchaeota archaeon]|nr:thioredoxin family protein [Candidatus Aenigmarchaeota archaeon]
MKINLSVIVGAIILIVALCILFKPTSTTGYCSLQMGKEKVIFAYYDGCPACAQMKPIMKMRNDVYWLNIMDEKCKEVMVELNLNIRAVPTFVCTKNTSIQAIGAMSEATINEWIGRNC